MEEKTGRECQNENNGNKRGEKRKRDDETKRERLGTEDVDWLALAPRSINVAEFAEARVTEINSMMKAVHSKGGSRRVFQTLPRHMRRRAMSHNIKRLPRRLRKQAEVEVQKHKRAVQKQDGGSQRKSRRHRRKPQNLLKEYQRRSRKYAWLETHIWHAKRFHMAEKWGYKIPQHPNDKSVRAAYRAMAHHCLIQDKSYYGVIELTGPQGQLLSCLSYLTDINTGLTFASASYLSGTRHGTIMLYKCNQYPYHAIAPVDILWKPLHQNSSEYDAIAKKNSSDHKFKSKVCRQLWIWVHPSSYEAVLQELCEACCAVPVKVKKKKHKKMKVGKDLKSKTSDKEDVDSSKEADVIIQKCYINKDSDIRINALRQDVIRFQLQGPLSHSLLLEILKSADGDGKSGGEGDLNDKEDLKWWETHYKNQSEKEVHGEQSRLWQLLGGVQRCSELPPNCVIGLTVRDPRVLLPLKKMKVDLPTDRSDLDPDKRMDVSQSLPNTACCSPIWDKTVRMNVSNDKMSVNDINKKRSQHVIPGSQLYLGRQESRIPVLLLHNPGNQDSRSQLGLGSGWDLIFPQGWGMGFWIALVYAGGRAGGERESLSVAQQQGVPHFPYGYPDTQACITVNENNKQQLEAKHLRYPPDKRPNYTKLGVVAPHYCPWDKLVTEWNECDKMCADTENDSPQTKQKGDNQESVFFVMRSRTNLNCLDKLCHPQRSSNTSNIEITPRRTLMNQLMQEYNLAVVCVNLRMVLRGVVTAFAMVCLPTSDDIQCLHSNKQYGGPSEPLHKDPSKVLKKLEKKLKTKKSDNELDKTSKAMLLSQMNSLSNPVITDVSHSCSRSAIGYVYEGSHRFSTGVGCALAFCALPGLLQLLADKQTSKHAIVLVRNTNSVQYRFAYMDVVTKM
ncbi:ribonucleases P/MRP protein subunit POP1-like [Glandiceps talaboti]